MEKDKKITISGTFLDLLDELEKISIDFINLDGFINYIYITPRNDNKYMISNVINNNETYIFQYKNSNNELFNIPNAIFINNYNYDFIIDIENKTFTNTNQNEYTIIDIDIPEIKKHFLEKSVSQKHFLEKSVAKNTF